MDNKLNILPLQKANEAFSNALAQAGELEEKHHEIYRAAIIQNFEFSFELCWKFMRRWLENEDRSEVERILTKKDLFRLAEKRGLIQDSARWFEYLNARNRTSHIYDEIVAEEVFKVAKGFFPDFRDFVAQLEKKI